ncbi:uncharacterized protein LTR77_000906 [Saxophila tyrrhenica]|uniref:Uncharacterized protein n=1 Tax=Saxophila tyrrhenica TaxID=1690608 RepID=A0AAV9PP30_9PEZI|nr:hypothetical protein LTR77_000906 [Saxophila tyrrhenica]
MSGRGRYYSQQYSKLDDDPSTWSSNIDADAVPEPYDPTDSSRDHPDAMPLEPYPHYQADYNNPLNRYSEQLPSSHENSPTRGPAPTRPTFSHSRATSYQPEYERGRPTSYQPEYEDFEALKTRSARPAKPARTWPWTNWSRKRKWIIFGSAAGGLILLIIIIAVAVALTSGSDFKYTPRYDQVTNAEAFNLGGATRNSVNNTQDGVGPGADTYTYYQGDESNFPDASKWVSFEDMWTANLPNMQTSCSALDIGSDNTDEDNQYIYEAIQSRANASLVDHRFILATIMQESAGCVRVGHTTSSGGVTNPGIMQSHKGQNFDSSSPRLSILQMVQDGTQGTEHGDGLVQNLDLYSSPYKAARGYNSGYIPKSGDLSEAAGATACYVSDIANRLTGWTNAKSTCPGDEKQPRGHQWLLMGDGEVSAPFAMIFERDEHAGCHDLVLDGEDRNDAQVSHEMRFEIER